MYKSRLSTIVRRSNDAPNFKEEDDDIGRKIEVMFYEREHTNTRYIRTIDFSTDVLQYLIKNGKLTVNLNSPSSDSVLSLSVNDSGIPLLQSDTLNPKVVDNIIVNITIKNIFDAYRLITTENEPQEVKSFMLEYEKIYSGIKKYYKELLSANTPTKLFVHDNFENLVKTPIPCSTTYPKELIPPGLDSKYLEDDFILSYSHSNRFKLITDCLKKFYMSDLKIDAARTQLPTAYLDKNGEIHRTVIIDDSIPHPQPNKKFIIVGTNYIGMNLNNTLFQNLPRYDDVLNDQRNNYESWLKQYTWQELNEQIAKQELDEESLERLKSVEDVQFADYILNKKKIAGIDFDYIKKMGLLSNDEFNEMLKYLKWKVNKMCVNKFNKPNCSIQYLWRIMEVTINPDGKPDFNTLEHAINTVRELNEIHKPVLERVQQLSWTTMLELNGIISQKRPEDAEYKQVFTEVNLLEGFALESYYIHPLNYKTNYFYHENKVFFLEELIANCALKCDGEFPGMEQFKGLPFYAVVPINITSYPAALNSSFYFKGVKCNPVTNQQSRRTNNYTAIAENKMSKKNNANNSKGVSKKTLSYRNVLLKPQVPLIPKSNNVLDKTIIKLADGTEINTTPDNIEKQRYLEKLFNSRTVKVFSTLITVEGLLVVILLDTAVGNFYYLLLEVNLKQSRNKLIRDFRSDDKQNKLTQTLMTRSKRKITNLIESFFKGNTHINIYGAKDLPLINIYLVMEFTPSNKIFTALGNECIYKLFSEQHEFFTKPTITLDYNGIKPNVEINNFYGYMLISLINKLNPIKSVLEDALKIHLTEGEMLKYYRIKDDNGYRMVAEDELLHESNPQIDKINYEGIKDNKGINNKGNLKARNNTLKIESDLFPNNNVFMTVGQHYIVLMNKYYEDELKTQYIPKNKKQLQYHFKFTTWVLTREYVLECLKIIEQHSGDNLHKINVPALFKLTSIFDGDLVELDKHIQKHSEYIKNNVIAKDPYKCKDMQPEIVHATSSDISSSIMHLHILNEIIHEISFKKINYKKELLTSKTSLYDMPTVYSYRINKLMNKFKTNNNTIKNCYINPFNTAMKLSYLIQLPMT